MERRLEPAQVVTTALKERAIPFKRDEIALAFHNEADSAKNTKWVKENLNIDTLLSKEELLLYSRLESSGALPSILYHADFDATRPFLDLELRKAIDSLNASTAEIQRQTEILTSQCEILNKQIKRDEERQARHNRDIDRLRQKHVAGKQQIAAASSDLAHELEFLLKNESENATVEGKKILASLTTRLKEDDKIFADLERLAAGARTTDDDASILKQTSELSTVLSRYIAEEINYRLDRLYLEEVVLTGQGVVSDPPADHDVQLLASLEGELESLCPEIDILAEMSTKQQFVEPILRELQNHHGQLRVASHQKLDYILGMVTEMAASVETLAMSLQDRESYCATLEAFISTYRLEVGDQILDPANSRRETWRRFSTQPAPTTTLTRKRTRQFPESESLEGLLRRIGLSFESIFNTEEGEGGVNTLIGERRHMLDNMRSYGIASDSPLVAELITTDQAIQLLFSSLNADSDTVTNLSSAEHENSLTELEFKLGYIQKGIERLNQDVVFKQDKNQEKFLERWR